MINLKIKQKEDDLLGHPLKMKRVRLWIYAFLSALWRSIIQPGYSGDSLLTASS